MLLENALMIIEENPEYMDIKSNLMDNSFVNWALHQEPDSGPDMPKKKRPKFI